MFAPPFQPFAALAFTNVASTSASLTYMDFQTDAAPRSSAAVPPERRPAELLVNLHS